MKLGEIGPPVQGRLIWTKGEQRQDTGGGALIDQEAEQLERGRTDPVRVFHDKEHGLLGGDAQQDHQQDVESLLLVLLRRHCHGRIVRRQRQEEGGTEGHRLRQWRAILHQEPLQFAHLLLGRLLPIEAQDHPLQQVDQRIQGCAGGRTNTDTG